MDESLRRAFTVKFSREDQDEIMGAGSLSREMSRMLQMGMKFLVFTHASATRMTFRRYVTFKENSLVNVVKTHGQWKRHIEREMVNAIVLGTVHWDWRDRGQRISEK